MYLGRIVESADATVLFEKPMHPYTERLLKSIPKLGIKARVRLEAIEGTVPIPLDPPTECGFYSRCSKAMEGRCNADVPALVELEDGHFVRCFLFSQEKEPIDD